MSPYRKRASLAFFSLSIVGLLGLLCYQAYCLSCYIRFPESPNRFENLVALGFLAVFAWPVWVVALWSASSRVISKEATLWVRVFVGISVLASVVAMSIQVGPRHVPPNQQ